MIELSSVSSSPTAGRRFRWPWIALGGWALLAGASVVLNSGGYAEEAGDLLAGPFLGGYAVVGALACTRRDGHVVGWLLLAVALGATLDAALAGYGARAAGATYLPAEDWARWISGWLEELFLLGAALFVPLLFPNGRLQSPRWRIVAAVGAVLIVAITMNDAFGLGWIDWAGSGAAWFAHHAPTLVALPLAAAIIGLALRLRHSRGVEHEQLKWLAYATLLFGIGVSLLVISEVLDRPPIGAVGWGIVLVVLAFGLPAAVGIAVLRHRLYDIDVVIRRTLVYSALIATLGGAYLVCILVLQRLSQPLTGDSGLAVAASTLAVAALFRPARASIRSMVDRRFYRDRYDTARTLDAFGARLRHEVDADAVTRDLRATVDQTLHPTHLSIWLRAPKRER